MKTVQFIKDPTAVLDWGFDWNSTKLGELPWLAPGEIITSYVITADPGITVDRSSLDENGYVKVWLSGGELGVLYSVSCTINTIEGRTDTRSIKIKINSR